MDDTWRVSVYPASEVGWLDIGLITNGTVADPVGYAQDLYEYMYVTGIAPVRVRVTRTVSDHSYYFPPLS